MALTRAAEAFQKWAMDNKSKLRVDEVDKAAMGFAAGWDAAQADEDLREAIELLRDYARIYPNNSGRAIRFLNRSGNVSPRSKEG